MDISIEPAIPGLDRRCLSNCLSENFILALAADIDQIVGYDSASTFDCMPGGSGC